ncbi:SGNH/GDSL hydrolase family protein [Hahella ganghwensis]|uniref:SGNH/GDSL hydrolase family protein n=1 Tax=Hahella ganghwensis TaxID=286420 RepID=UPI000367A16B|nr:SGNH/GDSL hydrolase family protein [Hahella ganghwensis]
MTTIKLSINSCWRVVVATFIALSVSIQCAQADLPSKATAAGDSITMGFAADCTGNIWFWDLFCLLGGDQPEHSWFDGSDSSVYSVHDRYKNLDSNISANKNAAASGSEMRGGGNNFTTQANNIVAQTNKPDHVEVLLGGNDLCNRGCTDPANCDDPIYTDSQWRSSVRDGLDVLVGNLPTGSTVHLGSVPRVQDLRAAGLALQSKKSWTVNCESLWSTFGVCRIATNGGTMNGESFQQRYNGVSQAQRRYNEILAEEAAAYNSNSNGRNDRSIEVVADYVDENTPSAGTYVFGPDDIDGGDCFHPSIRGQNLVADILWNSNPDN